MTTLDAARELLERSSIGWGKVCLVVESGSTAHGVSSDSSDIDLTVVWTENLRDLVVDHPRAGSRVIRTQPDGVRSGPGDIDMQVYSMRRFVGLAAGGNPSVLSVLFTPPEHQIHNKGFPSEELVGLIVSQRAGAAYLGYFDGQLKRWREGTVSQRVNRPELVAEHGFDRKYAAHAIRLGLQGTEYLLTGRVTLPIPEPDRSQLAVVRNGPATEVEAFDWAVEVREQLVAARDISPLPKHPDQAALDDFLVEWHRNGIC